ncbi:MAG: class I SAM-dependent methyltransferase [Candidatus Kryptoniota bacterium]
MRTFTDSFGVETKQNAPEHTTNRPTFRTNPRMEDPNMSIEHGASTTDRASAFADINVTQSYRKYLEPYIFQPWAERLVDFARLEAGHTVLDVASGTGVVARAAARIVGASGRIVASDISPVMVAEIANHGSDGAPIDVLLCSAADLRVEDHSFDRVMCQQGLPFIPDRASAVSEMRRAVRSGGMVVVAVFLCGHRCEPFETYLEVLRDHGVEPPFPNAYDTNSYVMSEDDVRGIFEKAGFRETDVCTEQIEVSWPDAGSATVGLFGTPFGAAVSKLEPSAARQVVEEIAKRFGGSEPVTRISKAVFTRAVA